MPTDIAFFIENYGLSAGILLLLIVVAFPLGKWIISINNLTKDNKEGLKEVNKRVDNVHLGCHVPIGAVKELETKVGKLEIKDAELDGDVKEINEHLKSLDTTIGLIHTSVGVVNEKLDQMMLLQVQNSKNGRCP